jgi:hypothetical protein
MEKRTKMPGPARAGLGLLIVGAIMVGVGSYTERGAVSLYGLVLSIVGFSLYIVASIIVRKKSRHD